MPALGRARWSIRVFLAVVGIGCGLSIPVAAQGNQNVVLPNPTPRDQDLHDKYKEDPTDKIRQQQAALLRSAQQRELVKAATTRAAALAEQLKKDMEKHEPGAPLGANAQTAAEIEKLAKTVKNTLKSQ